MIAIMAMIGAIRNNRCVKISSRVRQNGMFCSFAAARSAGERLSTQLKTKNITVNTIMMCACEMLEHFFSAPAPYSSRFATAKEEMIGSG